MKRVILNIDDNYSDVITVTAVGVRGNITDVNVSAHEINNGDIIRIPAISKSMEVNKDENH